MCTYFLSTTVCDALEVFILVYYVHLQLHTFWTIVVYGSHPCNQYSWSV